MAEQKGIPTGSQIEVVSPATRERLGEVAVDSPAEVKAAVARARQASRIWAATPLSTRAKVLRLAGDSIFDHREELVELLSRENGKPRMEALTELAYVGDMLAFYGRRGKRFLDPHRITPHMMLNKRVTIHYQPRGVIGFITPWNFPLILTVGEAIPALVAGNAVVIKPSEWTPLIARRGVELLRESLAAHGVPVDIIQVVNGYGETGAELVDEVDMISFTGSTATGRRVAMRAAERLIPCSLELGGKDPMIVLRDADLERAANAAVWGAFTNSGQVCISVERVYVDATVADRFTDLVVARTRELRQGFDGDEADSDRRVDVGAMTWPRQIETVTAHVDDAREKGAAILTGGRLNPALPGNFYEPTVLAGVDHSMRIMTEETFGPVLPIMPVQDEAEALRLANDSRYALNASVWTANRANGERLAANVAAGITCVNDVIVGFAVTDAPSGGLKESGIGKRHGAEGIRRFCNQQVIITDRFGLKRELIWYPYSAGFEKGLARVLSFLYSNRLSRKIRALFG